MPRAACTDDHLRPRAGRHDDPLRRRDPLPERGVGQFGAVQSARVHRGLGPGRIAQAAVDGTGPAPAEAASAGRASGLRTRPLTGVPVKRVAS
ncbi:hypothetical protein EASAB2608_01949 [Streptomyces sp. EAS-AB2608]|nr:hypothetical protein EASAB2608_01949 [Streptomyces sp. EAS-AB2608]